MAPQAHPPDSFCAMVISSEAARIECKLWLSGMRIALCALFAYPSRPRALSYSQLVEQDLSLLQIERVEAFGEPAIDRSEKVADVLPLAQIALEPRHADGRSQFKEPCVLYLRHGQGLVQTFFRLIATAHFEKEFAFEAM
jgi:hypothetical protein